MKEPYPADIFPMLSKKDLDKYKKMFEKAKLSQDRYSAYCMRIAYRNGWDDCENEFRSR